MLRGKLVLPSVDLSELRAAGDRPPLEIAIADPAGCPRYTARVIDGLAIGPSPRRIAQRLRNVGVRPISNLVDVDQLRDVRARPAAPRVRRPHADHRRDRRVARGRRREVHHARRRRAHAGVRRPGDPRRHARGRARRRDGRARHRGHRAHDPRPARGRELLGAGGAADRAPARPALRGIAPLRARRRPRARGAGLGAHRAPAVPAGRRPGARRADRRLPRRAAARVDPGPAAAGPDGDRRRARPGDLPRRAGAARVRRADRQHRGVRRGVRSHPAVGARRRDPRGRRDRGDPAGGRLRAGAVELAGAAPRPRRPARRSRRRGAAGAGGGRGERGHHLRLPVDRALPVARRRGHRPARPADRAAQPDDHRSER